MLSEKSAALWRRLMKRDSFELHERVALERALTWFDVSDRLALEADSAAGTARAALLKSSMDASTAGLRYWRQLKWIDPSRPAVKLGRKPGDAWSLKRQQSALTAPTG